ncbi:MAG: hypothetical protein SFW67_09855 [Myxococcaceae bacterium]|nr:hypothetical protein [Myxococcaceae bacterium]
MRTSRTDARVAKAPAAPAASPSPKKTDTASAPAPGGGWKPKAVVRQAAQHLQQQAAQAQRQAQQFAAQTGLFRVGMDNANPTSNADATAFVKDKASAHAHVDARLEKAQAFLTERGLEGQVVAKLVTADIVNVAGMDPVEHAEWQFFLVPKPKDGAFPAAENGLVQRGKSKERLPGLLDEKALTAWVEAQGVRSEGSSFLRSSDNPLFLGRLNYGTAGSGLYTKVPDYAEVGGHRYDTRAVEGVALSSPEKLHAAVDALYTKHPGAYGTNGVCHQGAVLVAEALGLDPVKDAARHIDSLWASRFKFGRLGRELP